MDKSAKEEFERVHRKLDGIDEKLDGFTSSIVEAKRDIHWISGHLKVATAIGITVVSGIILYLLGIKG